MVGGIVLAIAMVMYVGAEFTAEEVLEEEK